MNILLRCPECGTESSAPSAVGVETKTATCANCKKRMTIGQFFPKYSLKVDGRNYQLRFGRQWVGRMKEGNDAEVQIPDETLYMSKKHAVIELFCTQNGIECTFEEHGKNPTVKDGKELMEDDIIYLAINDCLTMGGKSMYLAQEYGK